MIPLASNRNAKGQSGLGKSEIPVTLPVTQTSRKSTRKRPLDKPADDHLETIVEALRRLPEAEQAEVIRRLGNPQGDPGLSAILAAWPKLPPGAKSGLVAAAEAFAKPPADGP